MQQRNGAQLPRQCGQGRIVRRSDDFRVRHAVQQLAIAVEHRLRRGGGVADRLRRQSVVIGTALADAEGGQRDDSGDCDSRQRCSRTALFRKTRGALRIGRA